MSNYVGICRSNYFAVNDEAAFKAWAEERGFKITSNTGTFALFPEDGWTYYNDEKDENVNALDELHGHIANGHVAVCIEIGYEGTRYPVGSAVAVDSSGAITSVSLDDIYERIAELRPGSICPRSEV
ncbi:MAG: hypothetical protein ACR2M1_08580 [Gemmatimonadaceae bacterium]